MPADIDITNGIILDPAQNLYGAGTLQIRNGRITGILSREPKVDGGRRIDTSFCDVSILKIEDGEFPGRDCEGVEQIMARRFVPVATVRAGKLMTLS